VKSSHFLYLVLSSYILVVISCEPTEEKLTTEISAKLSFSSDTVIFDTLLSSVGSVTKRLRIYNPNKNAIFLTRLSLGKGQNSPYNIWVNGEQSSSFTNEVIFGKDSLLVLIEVFIDPKDENLPFLVKDSLIVEANGNIGFVHFVAWGQDAIYIDNEILACNTTWTADRPYVIYNTAFIDTLCRLDVDPGARIFIDNGASLLVAGSLHLNGTLDKKITIRNTRFDARFENTPGQWDGIYFLDVSQSNEIHHANIKNGGRIGSPNPDHPFELTMSNTTIANMSFAGIIGFNSTVSAYNTLIYNCGQFTIGNFAGGNYDYRHCTFTNGQNQLSSDVPSFIFSDNFVLEDNSLIVGDLSASMQNCIVWGSQDEEFLISESGNSAINLTMNNNILRSTNEAYNINNNILSQERSFPGFVNDFSFNYQIDSLSNARDKGINLGLVFDLLGTERDLTPDIGAYEKKDSIP
jgi:hypothetical protein